MVTSIKVPSEIEILERVCDVFIILAVGNKTFFSNFSVSVAARLLLHKKNKTKKLYTKYHST